jgi:hypothetical protein
MPPPEALPTEALQGGAEATSIGDPYVETRIEKNKQSLKEKLLPYRWPMRFEHVENGTFCFPGR